MLLSLLDRFFLVLSFNSAPTLSCFLSPLLLTLFFKLLPLYTLLLKLNLTLELSLFTLLLNLYLLEFLLYLILLTNCFLSLSFI
jgi:hypothetical protein